MAEVEERRDSVGPVLQAGTAAHAVITAIQSLNTGVQIVDRGAYLRVLVRQRCVVTRDAIERELGSIFRLPGDLEAIMPSFKGKLSISGAEAAWTLLPGTGGRRC